MISAYKIKRKELLNSLYSEFNFRSRLSEDPIEFLYQYPNPGEMEIAAFLSSTLAFGRINLFKPVIRKILDMGRGDLIQFILDFNPSKDRKLFNHVYYRIWTGADLVCLIAGLKNILFRYGSLRNLFLKNYHPDHADLEETMIRVSEEFLNFNPAEIYGVNQFTRSFKYFLPSPGSGSACKRFCLFLRWMVRKDDLDPGTWTAIEPSKLIIPVDTHIFRVARFLKLTRLKTVNWKMAKEITQNLKEIDPADPLKFDFPLCHFSIRGVCLARKPAELCPLCAGRKKCYFKSL